MIGYIGNIEKLALENSNFRKVIFTAPHSQLVVMSLHEAEDIGMETHPENDQFIRVEQGSGKAILNGEESTLSEGSAVIIPSGIEHNIINTGDKEMKLYTVYSPAHHPDGTIHSTKADALKAEKEE